jgi:hypothetical protein
MQENKVTHNRSIIHQSIAILIVLCFFLFISCVDQLKPSKKKLEKEAEKEALIIKSNTNFQVPTFIQEEHNNLLLLATRISHLTGKTGPKALEITELLKHHFSSEVSFALPPLGLLPLLGKGQANPEMKNILLLTTRLKSELPHLLVEHLQITEKLEQLKAIAIEEQEKSVLNLVDQIKHHALLEEQILFPTVILIGDYLELKYPQTKAIAKPLSD